MKKSNNLVTVVYYDKAKKYLNSYLECINNQSTNNFDLLLVNDNSKLSISNKYNFNIIKKNVKKKVSYAFNRNLIIKYALNKNYKKIIFTDIDDLYSKNRIYNSIKFLESYDIVFNNILVNNKNKMIKKNFNKKNYLLKKLLEKNFLGFTNTSLKVKLLNNIIIPSNILAIDWYLFSNVLIKNNNFYFDKKSESFYNSYDGNIGVLKEKLSSKDIENTLNIKINHYKNMLQKCQLVSNKKYEKKYHELYDAYKNLKKITKSTNKLLKYQTLINNKKNINTWWEKVSLI